VEEHATVNARWPRTINVPGTTHFPGDAERREKRRGVTIEDKFTANIPDDMPHLPLQIAMISIALFIFIYV